MPAIDISPLTPEDGEEAAHLLATAFDGDPLHRAAFGAGVRGRSAALYRKRLASGVGCWYAARRDGELLGVAHWRPGGPAGDGCGLADVAAAAQLGWVDRLAMTVFRWTLARGAVTIGGDHEAPVALGPLAVRAAERGRGVGGHLLTRFCDELDGAHQTAYLETAQPANVPFYERFGFAIVDEYDLLGVPCVAMRRGRG